MCEDSSNRTCSRANYHAEITIRILSIQTLYFYLSEYILNWIVFGLKRPVGSQVVILDFRCLVISSLLFYFFITRKSSVLEVV